MTRDEEIKEHMISNNPDFKRLAEEHQSHDNKLRELANRPHVSGQEQIEQVQLKKKKLFLKDQMSRMIQQFRQDQDQVSHQHP